MKLFFMSDIHGSYYYLKKSLEAFHREEADYILILGDELYHGPRNELPKEYNPKAVAELLNEYKDNIMAVRGNCDSEVDQMLIKYPIMSDYSIVFYEGRRIFLTHGHIFNEENRPNLSKGDIIAYGHTHVPRAESIEDLYFLNPGSISLPKEGNKNSYGVLYENVFYIKDFDGNVIKKIDIR